MSPAADRPPGRVARKILAVALKSTGLRTKFAAGTLTPSERRAILHAVVQVGKERLKAEGQRLAKRLERAAKSESDGLGFSLLSAAMFTSRRSAVTSWAARVGKYLRELFVAGSLALLGPANLTQPNLVSLAAAHASQLTYLDDFKAEILDGEQQVDGTLAARAAMYASAAWGVAQGIGREQAIASGHTHERRVHQGSDAPCPGCEEQRDLGWQPIGTLKAIGDSPCRTNCHCHYEYMNDNEIMSEVVTMSKLTKKQRDALPESDFGDPARRLFPIVDQDDVDSAAHLIGKAKNPEAVKKRIIAIARRKGLKIPEAWKADKAAAMSSHDGDGDSGVNDPASALAVAAHVAAFDLGGSPDADGDFILYRDSLLFRAGDYPDRQYSMTPEELWAAVEQFEGPVRNELEHFNTQGNLTILDGKLGEVREVRLSDDGTELRGTVAIPKWLDGIWKAPAKQISAVWDRETKRLLRLGLTIKGRVSDAALMAAFSAAQPKAGGTETETPAEPMHEPSSADPSPAASPLAATLAALFDAANKTAHGQRRIQMIHDMAAEGGAVCERGGKATKGKFGIAPSGAVTPSLAASSMFTAARERSGLQAIHDLTTKHGASCRIMSIAPASYSASPAGQPKGKSSMNPIQVLKAALFGAKAAEVQVDPEISDDQARAVFALLGGNGEPPKPAEKSAAATPATPAAPATAAATFSDTPEGRAAMDRIRQLEETVERERRQRVKDDSIRFAAETVATFGVGGDIAKLLRDDMAALLSQLAEDDHKNKVAVTFSTGSALSESKTGDRVMAFLALVKKLPRSHMMGQYVDGSGKLKDGYTALFNEIAPPDPNAPMTPERRRQLLAHTDAGLAVLQAETANGKAK
jgi:hypothetical protein